MLEEEIKLNKLVRELKMTQRPVIAYSGGIYSTFLAAVAKRVLGDQILAITVMLDICPYSECAGAAVMADQLGIRHCILDGRSYQTGMKRSEMDDPCRLCDQLHVKIIGDWLRQQGYQWLLEGSCRENASVPAKSNIMLPKQVYLKSPLGDVGFTREEITALAHGWGIYNRTIFL